MSLLEQIRKNSAKAGLTTNWFKRKNHWYIFSNGTLFNVPEDENGELMGRDHLVEIEDQSKKDEIYNYYKGL